MIAEAIRVSMPLLELMVIVLVAFVLGFAAGLWIRGR